LYSSSIWINRPFFHDQRVRNVRDDIEISYDADPVDELGFDRRADVLGLTH